MPIYEYHCSGCGHDFEVIQKISDKPIRKCESCGKLKAKRKISQTSFILKGSGWYVTDYAGKKPANGSSPAESTDSSSESSSKTEKATPESKSKPADTKKAANA